MARRLNIQMPDASWLSIDQDDWRVLASPIHVRTRSDKKFAIDQLFVRQHADGQFLVYVVLEPASGEIATVAGEMSADNIEALSAVQRIVRRFSLPESIAQECMAVISNPPLP